MPCSTTRSITRSIAMPRAYLLLPVLVLTLGVMWLQAADPHPQDGRGSITDEDCALCHEETAEHFSNNPHVVLQKSPKFNMTNACETCHGPGAEHAEADGDVSKIIGFTGATSKTYNQQCMSCHQSDKAMVAFASGKHSRSNLSCADCHSVHSAAPRTSALKLVPHSEKARSAHRNQDPSAGLCMSCHEETKSAFAKPFHHRVPEGSMTCVDCHNPHGGFRLRQLRTGTGGETACAECHREKSGPFVFEHASLRIRTCQTCHEPHGSNYPKMLARSSIRFLCLECHSGSQSVVISSQPPSFHDLRSPRYQNCTTCHTQIHGSNASRFFLR